MRFKKGFTLAEVLVVLVVIGVIAMMTIPGMSKGAQEQQKKAGVKKAYNTLSSLAGTLIAENKMPVANAAGQGIETARFFIDMMENLNVKEVIQSGISTRTLARPQNTFQVVYTNRSGNTTTFGMAGGAAGGNQCTISSTAAIPANCGQLWIATEDGIAYTLTTGTNCLRKANLTPLTTQAQLLAGSCIQVTFDVNGLYKLPNLREPQSFGGADTDILNPITGDQFDVFIANNGIYGGSTRRHAVAKILSDLD